MAAQPNLLIQTSSFTIRIPVDSGHHSVGNTLARSFLEDAECSSVEIIALSQFIHYCSTRNSKVAVAAFDQFNRAFCLSCSIHVAVQQHNLDEQQARDVLKGYFSVWGLVSFPQLGNRMPALFSGHTGVRSMAIFGGQGSMDNYIDEARWLLDTYYPLLAHFVLEMSAHLQKESETQPMAQVYKHGLHPARWIESQALPEQSYLLTVPVSIPTVGLIQLMHLMVLYKTLGISPGELAKSFKVATGHSQGIMVAAALSMVTDEASFYTISRKVLGIMMVIGAFPQMDFPCATLNQSLRLDALKHEGAPYPMVSIQGLSRNTLEGYASQFNSQQQYSEDHVFIALENTRSHYVVSGELESMVKFVRSLRPHVASRKDDQTRVPLSQRKPKVSINYISVTVPYHCLLLEGSITKLYQYAVEKGWHLNSQDMNIPVRATEDGHDIRSERDLTRYLFRSGCILPVIWPKAIDAPGLTHVVDFGPGGYSGSGALAFRSIEGRGVAVICAGALVPRGSSLLGNKADLYKHQLKDITSALNWSEQFRPKLVRTAYNNRLHIDTPMHSILGLPPLMVAGMTPTTADTGFVAAIYNAGYHVELAGGGIYGANDLERKVSDLTHMIEPGCGITLNCIYVNQKQWSVQFPAMLRMRREGWPVAGLCIGGGVPSAENANYIISSLKSAGLRHVAFKPANSSAIKQVVAIARANSDFPVVLQWTGGRAGGHHSCEDFHQPILETYGAIRSQANIVLVAGSGFGDAKSTLPYITGDWSTKFGRAPMPFDGILLGSRVTVAKESGASQAVKELIASKSGFGESDWESASIVGNSGGVVSIESEFGEPNHVLATRGVALAHDMNTAIFSQPREKQVQLLHERKDEIISRLNSDYMRPWFGRKVNGQAADLEEMTYAEVINRLVELMYVGHQSRWIDVTYRNLVFDFVQRTEQRFRDTRRSPLMQACEQISEPLEFIARFIEEYPACQAEVLTSVDAMHFINLCKRRGQKPVPFVPVLDQDFKIWFTKDTIWQSNDLDAVVDRDPERIAMSLGPIAVRYANVVDEPIKDIMDGIYNEQIAALLQRYYEGDISSVPVEEYLGPAPVLYPLSQSVASSVAETEITYHLPSDAASLPDFDTWINNLAGHTKNWLHALLTSSVIIQDGKLVENYVRRIMRPRPGRLVTVELDGGEPASISITDSDGFKELDLFFEEEEDDIISLSIFHRNHAVCRAMCFDFTFNPSMIQAPIQEITDVREKRIQRFFIEIWQRDYEGPLESYYNSLDKHAVVRGKRTEVTKEDVSKYCRIIGNGSKHYPPNSKHATLAPMDYISILTSRNVFDRLTAEVAYIGLLNGVHLFNSVRYVEGQGPLVLGDMVDCASQITQIVNTDVGKKIEIATHIFRNGDRLAEVDSTFLCRGIDVDPKQTFRKVKEPATRVVLRSAEDVAVLESKEWFVYRDGAEGRLQPGSTVEFRLSSAYQYLAAAVYSSISTVGTVMLTVSDAQSLHIADVSFESGQSYGNPVTDYLEANGAVLDSTTLFDSGGYQIVSEEEGSTMTTVVHDDNWGYSLASGDCNPIHSNPYFADLAGLPGTITHGMWTSASTRRFIETYVANDHPGRVRAYSVSLIDMVFPKDRLETKLYHVGMKEGRMLIKGEIFNEKGDVVLACTSEVDQPATAYVFTGQGSQEVGMGMGLYQQSAAARSIWDRADRYMDDQYGISLLHIVKDNPREVTIHFGGSRGAQIRENYLRLKQLVDNRAGSPDRTPIWQDLSSDSDTLTFTSPTGLINATQFTQPAIVAFELAAFADLRSKSLVQHGATYAGHSMGEHSALFAVANIATVEDAIDIAFHRGMIMQSFIERDEHNRSEYTMVAANPSRVGPEFSEDHLHLLIGAIREHGQGLLEIVNYNVKDQQYVVAGSLKQLSVLGSALDKLAATKQKNLTAAHFGQTVADTVKRAIEQTAGAITELGRTRCTTPLTGIDVPFHSSHLLPGVDIFRSYLAEKLQARHIDCASLQNRYIPNVTAKPFTVSRKYSEDVFDATRSPVIQQLLATWDDSLLENEADVRCLAHTLLIELLSYQIALPVRWIDTQEQIFAKLGAERMIEIGPAPTLCGIANRTLPKLGKQQVDSPSVLHIIRDESTINYSDACLAESEAAAEPKGQPPTETAPNTRDQPAAQPPTLQSPPAAPVAPSAAPVAPSAAPVAPAVFAGQGIPDEQLSTIDVLQAVVAHKMKRGLDEVQTTKTLKELVGGKSTLQNEIIGDLHAEFGGNVPDKPEDLSLHELANGISGFDGALGKHTTAQISRLFSTKMPGGFAQSAARNILKLNYGLGPQRQDALLLAALMMEPPSRLGSEAEAKAWLDTVAQTYAKRAGITYSSAIAGSSGAGGNASGVVINSAEFEKAQREQKEHIVQQIQVLARYAGIDLREGARLSEASRTELDSRQARLDDITDELGSEFIGGIKGMFDARKARRYDSCWNWARQDALELVYSAVDGDAPILEKSDIRACIHSLANRSSHNLLSLVSGLITVMEKSSDLSVQQALACARRVHAACKESLGASPTYLELSAPVRPNTRITHKGDTEYTEVVREGEPSFAEYVQHMSSSTRDGEPPFLHLCGQSNEQNGWRYSCELSAVYFDSLKQMATTGLSFAGKTALVTGCGRGSIGADVLRGLLAGGAKVVATTSSYSRKATLFYEDMYKRFGARGSELVVVPFNQGSVSDIKELVDYIYSSKGLKWDLDFVVPFAAISEVGSDFTQINSRSELAHRIMLTNVLRLVGEVKDAKALRNYRTRPSLVVLPLSPNHGNFGGDGLYGESKVGLETMFNRWESESWSEYVSVAGAVIGWTRGTGLMNDNNLVAHDVEKLGVRTFSTREMAFNTLGLLHPKVVRVAQRAPIWADLNGGLGGVKNLGRVVGRTSQALRDTSSRIKAANKSFAVDHAAISGQSVGHKYSEIPTVLLANHKHHFPSAKTFEQLEHLRHLQGMVNLDKVVVVTGYGEVGPYGNSENRWEMEAFGEFSLEGCIELAWIMGLIKHHNGAIKRTGAVYTGWVDAKTNEPVKDTDVKSRYEEYILEHTGIRLIEPEMTDGYDPNKKLFLRELQIEHDMEPFEASSEEAAAFKHQNGDNVDIWENKDGSWSVRFLKGALLHVPKALRFDRLVAAQVPTGWDPARYGIPDDVIKQVDPVTCFALVATVEALVRSGITDPYELYKYFHVSEVGSTIGSGVGGSRYMQHVFRSRFLDKDHQNDALQEMFINTPAAWINMLLMSSSGPIKPVVGACATSVLSVDVAIETIQSGKAKMMLAGGYERFVEESSNEFAQMGATSNTVEELASGRTPREMCRPCTTTRNGFMEGEGAGIVTLMSAAAAVEIGAPIYAVVAMSGTATDKQGSSVPAPGKGVLTSARETNAAVPPRTLDFEYRRRQLQRRLAAIDEWEEEELGEITSTAGSGSDELAKHVNSEAERQRHEALDTWGSEFWKRNPHISPLRGALAVWGLTVDDIGVASMHGTSTVANDKNESDVLNEQFRHLGRTAGLAVPAVCQKWLTAHSKGAAAAFMLNGVVQILRTGIVPGNRNADNISAELEQYDYIVYPSRSIQTPGIKAALLKSFGFGQVGGELLVLHPDYLLATLARDQLEQYNSKLQQRSLRSSRYWQDTLVGKHPFVQVKDAPPYTADQEKQVYLDPFARADRKSGSNQSQF